MKTILSLLALVLLASCAFKVKTPVPFTRESVTLSTEVKFDLETKPANFQLPGDGELQIIK